MKIEFNVDNHQPTPLRSLVEALSGRATENAPFYVARLVIDSDQGHPDLMNGAPEGFLGEWCLLNDNILVVLTKGVCLPFDTIDDERSIGRAGEPGEALNVHYKIEPEDKVGA